MNEVKIGQKVIYYSSLCSTMDKAKELMEKEEEGTVIIAGSQEAGRGRLNKEWVSPAGGGLWFSTILKPDLPLEQVTPLTLLFGLAVAKAVSDFCHVNIELRWPNDLLLDGKKFCGVLSELYLRNKKIFVIVGIGINVNLDKLLVEDATSLKIALGKTFNEDDLLKQILTEMGRLYNIFLEHGFALVREEWKQYSVWGKRIITIAGEGIAEDITDRGTLVIVTANGERREILAGEVTFYE